ncbi:MAG TPA: hypothetical protein VFQ63_01535 [Patescibacteria group bacterium]|nr:hypothetical protein [Patescibacteria group bacterium]
MAVERQVPAITQIQPPIKAEQFSEAQAPMSDVPARRSQDWGEVALNGGFTVLAGAMGFFVAGPIGAAAAGLIVLSALRATR